MLYLGCPADGLKESQSVGCWEMQPQTLAPDPEGGDRRPGASSLRGALFGQGFGWSMDPSKGSGMGTECQLSAC